MSDMLERMVNNLLKNFGFDPQVLKIEVEGHIKTFEDNITRLNIHLGAINSRLENIENHLGIARSNGVAANDPNTSENIDRLAIENQSLGEPKLSAEYEGPTT
jgi:hypothetical protein